MQPYPIADEINNFILRLSFIGKEKNIGTLF